MTELSIANDENNNTSQMTLLDPYWRLCELINVQPITISDPVLTFSDIEQMSAKSLGERITAALQIFISMIVDDNNPVDRVDRVLLDHYIASIDQRINAQLDEIVHYPEFQKLESTWRSLKYLVDRIDYQANIKCEIINVSKESLYADFVDAMSTTASGLYQHIHDREYDTPGGEPVSLIISDYEFNSSAPDIGLLQEISKVSAAAHCPFIGGISSQFFHKNDFDEVIRMEDLANHLDKSEYIRWSSFRNTEDSRYIGLTLPRFLLRLPYGYHNPVRSFNYEEGTASVKTDNTENYLWGNASFAFAANMVRSFKHHGWVVNIRGPESGGRVDKLLLHQYDVGKGLITKIPTQALIPETCELDLANLGFIPLSYYKNTDYACFFSANSCQKPAVYDTAEATANSRINSRLPYVFLSCRLGHYLKVLQREKIGSDKSRSELEQELNAWLQTLVTKMNNPGPEIVAKHPLREGKVTVEMIPDNPGFYRVVLYFMPHFQVEGVDIQLSLVAKMPGAKEIT